MVFEEDAGLMPRTISEPKVIEMTDLLKGCTRLFVLGAFVAALAAGCGDEPATSNDAQNDGPCPCSGNAECEDDVCVASLDGDCSSTDYVCDDGLVCQGGFCLGDEGFSSCVSADECRGALSCLDETCETPCPCDGTASCEQNANDKDVCVAPPRGPCGEDGYQCDSDEDLVCENDECIGDDGFSCVDEDDCRQGLDCIEGTCQDYDGPCPCNGDAECDDDGGEEICLTPIGSDCGTVGYECEDGLVCEDDTCIAEDEWVPCNGDDQCAGTLECIGGFCTEDTCSPTTSCPDDGDSETVDQNYCTQDGANCVQCRHWAGESADYGDADCPDDQVCTSLGYCADRIDVPRDQPFGDSMTEAEAVAIATAVCSLETEHQRSWTGSVNTVCGTIVSADDAQSLDEADVRDPAEDGDFDYLADEVVIDGQDGSDVVDHIDGLWDGAWSDPYTRYSWFSEGDMSSIPSGSRGEIVVWMGKGGTGSPWRIGIDTIEGYFDRGYVEDWNEDGD